MGTVLEVTLPSSKLQYADSVYAIFNKLDSLFHPTKKTSDVFRINENAGRWTKVAKETADCVKKSLILSEETKGAFDITVGKMVNLWHFEEEGKYTKPPQDTIEKYKLFVDYRRVKAEGDSVFIGKGQEITLSGIAKGYALDLVRGYLLKKGITSGIVNAGGDMLILGKKHKKAWMIGIQKPWDKGVFMVLDVKDKFVATSGNYVRYLKENDTTYTHIFNPKTGIPLEYKKLSVTVISDSGYIADGLATALSVMGKDEGLKLANRLKLGLVGIYDEDTVINYIAKKYIERDR